MARYRVKHAGPFVYVVERARVIERAFGPVTHWEDIFTAASQEAAVNYANMLIAAENFKPSIVWESE